MFMKGCLSLKKLIDDIVYMFYEALPHDMIVI